MYTFCSIFYCTLLELAIVACMYFEGDIIFRCNFRLIFILSPFVSVDEGITGIFFGCLSALYVRSFVQSDRPIVTTMSHERFEQF